MLPIDLTFYFQILINFSTEKFSRKKTSWYRATERVPIWEWIEEMKRREEVGLDHTQEEIIPTSTFTTISHLNHKDVSIGSFMVHQHLHCGQPTRSNITFIYVPVFGHGHWHMIWVSRIDNTMTHVCSRKSIVSHQREFHRVVT